jgi:hypothetical protein
MSPIWPSTSDEFSSNFFIRPRVAGGYLIHWIRHGVRGPGWFTEQDNSVAMLLLDSNFDEDHRWTFYTPDDLWGPDYAYVISWTADTAAAFASAESTESSLMHVWPDDAESAPTTFVLGPLAFERISQNNLLVLSHPIQGQHTVSFIARVEWDGTCTFLGDVDMLQIDAISFHPSYGFALLHVTPNSLQLARVDTNGVQTLPTGTLFWRDENHTFTEANVTITDAGLIVAAWTETQDGDTAARRLMLGTVGWDTPLSATPQSEVVASPKEFSLSAYPNPFNSTLEIRYEVPQAGNVELAVFNVLGQKVTTLENGMRSAGTHNIAWTAKGGSGIYFVTLQAEHAMRTEKVLLAR